MPVYAPKQPRYYSAPRARNCVIVALIGSLSLIPALGFSQFYFELEYSGIYPYLDAVVTGPVQLTGLIYELPYYPNNIFPGGVNSSDLVGVIVTGQGATLFAPPNWGPPPGEYGDHTFLQTAGSGQVTVNADLDWLTGVGADGNSVMNLDRGASRSDWIYAGEQSTINVYGADLSVGIFGTDAQGLSDQPTPDCTINIHSGFVANVYGYEDDTINLFGGTVTNLASYDGDAVNIYGTGLYAVPDGGNYRLYGTLSDGTVMNGVGYAGDLSDLHFFAAVPEPASVAGLGICTLGLLCRRRVRIGRV